MAHHITFNYQKIIITELVTALLLLVGFIAGASDLDQSKNGPSDQAFEESETKIIKTEKPDSMVALDSNLEESIRIFENNIAWVTKEKIKIESKDSTVLKGIINEDYQNIWYYLLD